MRGNDGVTVTGQTFITAGEASAPRPPREHIEMKNITIEKDNDGIALATIDMPGRPFNVFSADMMDDLETLIDSIEHDRELAGVVLTSGKSAFMAGADLAMVRGFTSLRFEHGAAEIRRIVSRLTYLLRRLEQVSVPTVAAINGLALGGGLELAMACHHRIAAEGAAPCLGLPEILLGLLPGAGGTQRLPRLVGPTLGARMLLDGRPITAADALTGGLVDALAEPGSLVERARSFVREAAAGARWDRPDWQAPADADGLLGTDGLARLWALSWIESEVSHLYPAVDAICRCLLDGYDKAIETGIEVEIDNFMPLMLDPVAGNMVRTLFLSKTAAPKRAAKRLGAGDVVVKRLAVAGDEGAASRIARRFEITDDVNGADAVIAIPRRRRKSPPAPPTRRHVHSPS